MEKFSSWLNAVLWSKKNDTNGEEIPGVDPVVRLNEGNLVLTNGDPNKLDSFGNSVKASFVDMEFMNAFISLVGESVIGSERKVVKATNNLANHKFLDWRLCDGSVIGLKADFQPYADLFPEYVDGLNVKTPDYRDKLLKMKGTTGSTGGSDTTDVAYAHDHTATTTSTTTSSAPPHEGSFSSWKDGFDGASGIYSYTDTGIATPKPSGNVETPPANSINTNAPHTITSTTTSTTTIANSTGGSSTKSIENAYLSTAFYICVGIKKDAFKHAGNP